MSQKIETKIQKALREVVESFDERYVVEGLLKKDAIITDIDNYKPELVEKILTNPILNEAFTEDIAGATILKINDIIQMLEVDEYWSNSYTRYINKIGLTTNNRYLDEVTDVVINFPYKDGILKAGMTKDDVPKKDAEESFLNEIVAREEIDVLLDKKILKNVKKCSQDGFFETSEIQETDNLIIKGNNLLSLYSLKERLKKMNKSVKLIYIDPPYYFIKEKKEDTFPYNSNFKLSTWLTFMKNRLEIARDLLSDDGAIFVQINDDGVGELHVLLKEVFKKENFINKITVKTKSPSGFASVNPGVFETAEYILSFAKDKAQWKYNPQFVRSEYDKNYKFYITNKDENFSNWKIENIGEYVAKKQGYENKRKAYKELGQVFFDNLVADFALQNSDSVFRETPINDNASAVLIDLRDKSKSEAGTIFFQPREDNYDVYVKNGQELTFYSKKIREIDGERVPSIQLSNIWTDIPYEGIAKEGGVKLKGGKKPEKLLRRIIELATDEGDLVLDYHLGSGTTAAVAHKLNRQYIGFEQLDYGENDSVARLERVVQGENSGISKMVKWSGGGSFIYAELMDKNSIFIDSVLNSKNSDELKTIFDDMKFTLDFDFRVDLLEVSKSIWNEDFDTQKKILVKIIDKNQLYYNYSEIEDTMIKSQLSESDIAFNKSFYGE
jgi:type III restriction/modification enzyme, methylase subunit